MKTGTYARAIHQDGALKLLTPLELPEGIQVSVIVLPMSPDQTDQAQVAGLAYPTRLVSADKLDRLTDLVAIGGDALADSADNAIPMARRASEALYD